MAFILDTRQFNSQLTKYLNFTQKNVATQVNKRSANIIMKSMQYTRRADASAINALMRREVVNSEVVKYPKAGKSGGARIVRPKSPKVTRHATLAAYKIYNYWRKRRGMKALGGKQMSGKTKIFIDSIVKSVAYITSGWYPALNLFKRAGSNVSGVKPPSNPKGTASKGGGIVAKPGPVVRSYFYNSANPPSRSDKKGMNVSDIAGRPLDIAMSREEADMKEWLEDEMKKTADKVFTNI
jgi:hypothetical protein